MGQLVDLKRKRFGHLTVIRKSIRKGSCASWWCLCDCGVIFLAKSQGLVSGNTKHCGCRPGDTINKECAYCGKIFNIPACRDWREKCCSSDCKLKKRSEEVSERRVNRKRACKICGSIFYPRGAQIANGDGVYCSTDCQHKGIKGRSLSEDHKKNISISLKNSAIFKLSIKRGPEHNAFKYKTMSSGYVFITVESFIKRAEHRVVLEQKIGRKLTSKEIIHHKDFNKTNNDPDNLEIMSRSGHAKLHIEARGLGMPALP